MKIEAGTTSPVTKRKVLTKQEYDYRLVLRMVSNVQWTNYKSPNNPSFTISAITKK